MNFRPYKIGVLIAGIICVGVLLFSNLFILQYKKNIIFSVQNVPTSTVAIIFGGGMEQDGDMSIHQTLRVEKGIELYKMGKVTKLFMTGDDGKKRFNEVDAMEKYAVERGVPKENIEIDRAGYRTYESCYREKNVYNIQEAIVVSQPFHLPRIQYLCEGMGIHVIPVAAENKPYNWIREILARLKAVWQLGISHPTATTLEK